MQRVDNGAEVKQGALVDEKEDVGDGEGPDPMTRSGAVGGGARRMSSAGESDGIVKRLGRFWRRLGSWRGRELTGSDRGMRPEAWVSVDDHTTIIILARLAAEYRHRDVELR